MIRPWLPAAMLIAAAAPSALFARSPSAAPGVASAPAATAADLGSEAMTLSPGRFAWANAESADGEPIRITVSVPQQLAFVYRGAQLIGVSTVSTGKPGHDTPLGSFAILQKKVDHGSNLYDDAPMPFMQRLTWDGVALHAGNVPGYPASHGCVRLPAAFAKRLFALTRVGAIVTVTDEVIAPTPAPAPALPPLPDGSLASNGDAGATSVAAATSAGSPALTPEAQSSASAAAVPLNVQLASMPAR